MAVPVLASVTTTAVTNLTSHVVAMPATRPDGDLYLVVVNASGTGGTFTAPAGWTAYGGNPVNETGSNTNQVRLWWRVGSGEPATYIFTLGSARSCAWAVLRLVGAAATPLGTPVTLIETVTGGVLAPRVTPAENDGLVLYVAGCNVSASNDQYVSPVAVSGVTFDANRPAGAVGTNGVCLGVKTAVAPGSGVSAGTFHFPNGGGSSQNIGVTVCVRAASPRAAPPSRRRSRSAAGGGTCGTVPLLNTDQRPTAFPGQTHTAGLYWNKKTSLLSPHGSSAALCTTLWNSASPAGHFLFFDRDFTYPQYYVQDATVNYTVSCTFGNMNGRAIAWNPAWTIPASGVPGADAQFILLDLATGEAWNGWEVTKNDTTHVLTCTRCNRLDTTGDDSTYGATALDWRTSAPSFLPSRGCGNDYAQSLVMPEHFERGIIPFALPLVIPASACNTTAFVAPATKNGDGTGAAAVPSTIPYGQRFGLSATTFTDAVIATLGDRVPNDVPGPAAMRQAIRVLATAFRDYGGIVCDTGGAVHIQAEANESATGRWTALGWLPVTTSATGKRFPDHVFDLILAGRTPADLVAYA